MPEREEEGCAQSQEAEDFAVMDSTPGNLLSGDHMIAQIVLECRMLNAFGMNSLIFLMLLLFHPHDHYHHH